MTPFSRRGFIKGLALTAAGLVFPVPALVDAAPARRLWMLDSSMLSVARSLDEAEAYAATLARTAAELEAESLALMLAFADAAGRVLAQIDGARQGFEALALFTAPSPDALTVFR